jgi:hypothetical protein
MGVKIPPRRGVPKKWPALTVVNPGLGLNTAISDEMIQDAEASALSNVQFVESGCPAKRDGITAIGTGLTNNPKGLASYYPVSGSRYLLTVDGTSLKYLNGTAWTAISGASFTNAKNTVFVQARDDLYVWNGTDAGAKVTSSLTLTRPATTVSAAFGIFYSGKQIVSGVSTQPNRLYISNSTDASDFTVATGGTAPQPDNSTDAPGASTFAGTPGYSEANLIDIAKNDGDKITGLSKFNNQLIIFKERSIWSLTFDATGIPTVQQVSSSRGCVSHRSIDNVDNDIYFLSRQGYYTLGYQQNYYPANNLPRTNELSVQIHPVIDTIVAANLSNTASLFSGYTFYTSVSTGGTTTNNTTLTYDTRYKAWSKWTNINANSWTEYIDSSNVKHLYYAADDSAQVYEIVSGQYNDAGSAISASWTSKAFDFGDISLYKDILYIDFLFRQIVGTVSISVITDGNTTSKTTSVASTNDTTGTFGDEMFGDPMFPGTDASTSATISTTASANVPYRLPVNQTTRTVKVQIANANANEAFVFLGMKIYYRPYAPQRFPSSQRLT